MMSNNFLIKNITRLFEACVFVIFATFEALGQTQYVGYDAYECIGISAEEANDEHYLVSDNVSSADRIFIDKFRTIELPRAEYHDADYYKHWDTDFSKDVDSINKFLFSEKYMLYNQVVNGYKVCLRELNEDVVICFTNVKNGKNIIHHLNGALPMKLCVKPEDVGKNHHLFRADYKEYTHDKIANNDGACVYPSSIFQFVDVDFDGVEELLISELWPYREGFTYKIYKIVNYKLVELDYPPFCHFLANWCQLYPASKSIVKYANAGACYCNYFYFSKRNTKVKNRAFMPNIPDINDMPAIDELEEYLKLDYILFTLDSIRYWHPDTQNSSRKHTLSVIRFEY